MIQLPILHTSSGDVRIEPVSASLDLELEPLSSAELELKPGESIPERSWVSVFTEHGLAGIFRSKPQNDRYGERFSHVSLVHGAVEMNDWLTGKSNQTQTSAASAISTIFQSYGGTRWTLGTVSPSNSVVYELNNSGVLDAITEIMEQIPGYMITFDQSSTPWVMNVVARPSEVSAEGRLSRNVSSVEISRDDSSLCTRVYYGDNGAYVQDSTAVSKYGIIEHHISDSGFTAQQLAAIAQTYLDNHSEPKLSVSISAIDLYAATGETLDRITLGSKYRLAIPEADSEENRIIEQVVCSIRYDDLFSSNPQITLATEPETIITFLRKQRRAGGAARQVAKEEAERQYQHWVIENDQYKKSVFKIMGVTYDQDGNVIYQRDPVTGEIIYDDAGNPVPVYNPLSDGSIMGQVTESATSLETLYTKTGVASLPSGETSLFTYSSKVKQTADSVSSEVTAARDGQPNLSSKITQLSNNISLVVSDGEVDAASIILAINGGTGQSSTTIRADKIDLQGLVTAQEFETALANIDTLVGDVDIYGGVTVGGNLLAGSIDTESFSDYKVDGTSIGLGNAIDSITLSGPVNDVYTLTATRLDGTSVTIGNFNRAATSDTNLSGLWSSGKFTVTAQPQNKEYWTEITQGVASWEGAQVTIPIMATDTTSGGNSYATGKSVFLDVSSKIGSITNLSGTSIAGNYLLDNVPITASGTNLNPYTENVSLAESTYQVGSITRNCVTLSIDSAVIGRISTQDVYEDGQESVVPTVTLAGWQWTEISGNMVLDNHAIALNPYDTSKYSSTNITLPTLSVNVTKTQAVVSASDGTVSNVVATATHTQYADGQASVVPTFGSFAGTPSSAAQELQPGTYEFKVTTDGTTTTDQFYTVPSAPSPVVPKVSRSGWSNGQITFTAGTTGKSDDTVKILSATQIGTLNQAGDLISFNVYEQLSGDSEQATGATISAAIVKGTATPTTPIWQGDSTHKYNINATGSFTIGGQTITQNTGSISGGFEPTDAIDYGKKLAKGIQSLTVSQTSKSAYDAATTVPVDTVTGDGYYFVTATPVMGDPVTRKFHIPASGGGGSDRWARYIEDITLTADDKDESTWLKFATYNTGETESDPNHKTAINVDASAVWDAGYTKGAEDAGGGIPKVVKGAWNGNTCLFTPSMSEGTATASVTITPDYTEKLINDSSLTDSTQIRIKDGDDQISSFNLYLRRVNASSGAFVGLAAANSLIQLKFLAKCPIDGGGGGGEQYSVTSIDPIALTRNDITTSTKYPVLHFDDPSQSTENTIPLQIDASEVYAQGLADGSRLDVETMRIVPNPLTQNTTYTLYPSNGKNVMAGIQFTVDAPTGIDTASIGLTTDNQTIYNGWDSDNEDFLSTKYARVKVDANDGSSYYLKIDASTVYANGVAEGAQTAGYHLTTVTVQPETPNRFRQINVPTGTTTVNAVSGTGALYQVNSSGSLYLTANTISRIRYGYLYEWNDSTSTYQRVQGTGLGSWFYVGSNVTEVLAKSNLKVSLASTTQYTVATGNRTAYITDSNGTIEFYTKGRTVSDTYYIKT